jgi:hypothetical protein
MNIYVINSKEARDEAVNEVAQIRAEPKMMVEVRPYTLTRSQKQNRLMWMWLNTISKDLGMSSEALHHYCKITFLGCEKMYFNGSTLDAPRSTTGLGVGAFTDHLEKIEVLANSLGIVLQHPDDLYNEAMGRYK